MAGNIRRNRNNELLSELEAVQRALALQVVSGSSSAGPPGPQGDPGPSGEEQFQTKSTTEIANGAPTDVDYLVGSASGSLSAEIVVGVAPGGELGGTWAAPTVDATHSGSAHHAAYTHPNHSGEVTSVGDGAQTVAATHSGSAHHAAESGQSATHTHAGHDTAHAHSALTGVGATDHHTNASDPTSGEKTWLTNGLAGQVAFPATQSASGGANVLDDYEEGTWTPGLTFGGGSTGITTSIASGGYVKVGRQVYASCLLQLTSKGTSVGSAVLTGLPFVIAGTAIGYNDSVPGLANVTFNAYPWMSANLGAATLAFQETSTAGAQSTLTDVDFANNSAVTLSFFYPI